MQFEEVRRRLERFPPRLPDPPAVLEPIVVPGPGIGRTRPRDLPIRREAAALVLLYPDRHGTAHVVLIQRPDGPYRHAGEVALPGGAIEPDDASPEAAALREAHEEVGLAVPGDLALVGRLDPVDVRVSGFRLLGIVALTETEPRLVADPREVAGILRPPVGAFLPDAPVEIVELERNGWRLRFGAYPVEGTRVWGATARVLGQLGSLLGVSPQPPEDRGRSPSDASPPSSPSSPGPR